MKVTEKQAETYVQILQLVALQQIQIDLLDNLIEKKYIRFNVKYIAKSFQNKIEELQKNFFLKELPLEILTENEKLISFVKEEFEKTLSQITFELSDNE